MLINNVSKNRAKNKSTDFIQFNFYIYINKYKDSKVIWNYYADLKQHYRTYKDMFIKDITRKITV